MKITTTRKLLFAGSAILVFSVSASDSKPTVDDSFIAEQREILAKATDGQGFGPQSPRDIDSVEGANERTFMAAPDYKEMNLCNIHFHESAEHKGGEFTTFAGNGDGEGYSTGYVYDGELTEAELAPIDTPVGESDHGNLQPGDTIEMHYVYSTAQIQPGPTLGACLSESIANPQLRVVAQVYVLVNDESAASLMDLTALDKVGNLHQAVGIPADTGAAVEYAGSTTGPGYNEKGSPLQVSWSVKPKVTKVDINSVATWLSDNVFDESYAHGVRNLVQNPALLSAM